MRLIIIGTCVLLTACSATSQRSRGVPAVDPGPVYRGSVRYLMPELDDDYAPVDGLEGFGVVFEATGPETGSGLELGFWLADDEKSVLGVNVENEVSEISLGYRINLGTQSRIAPFFSAGVAYLDVERSVGPASVDDNSFGIYGQAGLRAYATEAAFFDFGIRAVTGTDLDFSGVETDADYTQFFVGLGAAF